MISESQTVKQFLDGFEATWAEAVLVIEEHLREMQAKRDETARQKLARSQSAPLSDTHERSAKSLGSSLWLCGQLLSDRSLQPALHQWVE